MSKPTVVRIGVNKKLSKAGGYYFTLRFENKELELRFEDIFDCFKEDTFKSLGLYLSHLLLSSLKKNPFSKHNSSLQILTLTPNGS